MAKFDLSNIYCILQRNIDEMLLCYLHRANISYL